MRIRRFPALKLPLQVACCVAVCALKPATAALAETGSAGSTATAGMSHTSHVLSSAVTARNEADRALVASATTLTACMQKKLNQLCATQRRSLLEAGTRLSNAERRLSRLAQDDARRAQRTVARRAPRLWASGRSLRWTHVARIQSFVLVRRVPGQASQYSIVHGTSATPPPVPGVTVRFSVRTNVHGSAWARAQSISYPPALPKPVIATAAPRVTVSGTTLTWTVVGRVSTYLLLTRATGQPERWSVVNGTSVTPSPVPGDTVRYSVRTAVAGSALSSSVSIAYPQSAPVHGSGASGAAANDGSVAGGSGNPTVPFEMGVVSGGAPLYELPFIEQIGARTARVEFSIDTPASGLEPILDAFAKAGIQVLPLASFNGTLPTTAEAENLAQWATEFGPGGTFWAGKGYPAATAITDIEFGNETNDSWQYSDNSAAAYASRAQVYAQRASVAVKAMRAANPRVGLLVQAGLGNAPGTSWVDNMFKAVPNLGQLVAGWTVHPYGPNWQAAMDELLTSTHADGASNTIPMYVTEWGLASDDGKCLDNNYGWSTCMTYAQAASTLDQTVTAMRARYGSRLAAFYLYQAHDQQPTGASNGREGYFGALRSDGAQKGAFTGAVESLLSEAP